MATSIHPKVQAVGAAGAAATLIVFVLAAFSITVPAAVVAAIVTLVTFGAGYFKRGPAIVAEVNADAAAATPVVEAVTPVVADAVKSEAAKVEAPKVVGS